MQIVLAGATGFVGFEVLRQALEAGHQLFPLVRDQSQPRFDQEAVREGRLIPLPLGAEAEVLARGFGLEPGALWINTAGLHRESKSRGTFRQAHQALVQYLLQQAKELDACRFVHLSAIGIEAEDAWAQSKGEAELLIQAGGLPHAILRSAPIYGIGDSLLDEVGAWMMRSPFIPRFLEDVVLQPLYVGDLAEALLRVESGRHEIGGEGIRWGDLLELCAAAAGKRLVGPRLSENSLLWLARTFGNRGWLEALIPFDEWSLRRHQRGYVLSTNALPALLKGPPQSIENYLKNEWAYRLKV